MRVLRLKDYDDRTGVLLHKLLQGESYTLTGGYVDGELHWWLRITSDLSNSRWELLCVALSECVVHSDRG